MIRGILTALFFRPKTPSATQTSESEPFRCGVPHLRTGGMLVAIEFDGARSVISDVEPPSAENAILGELREFSSIDMAAKPLSVASAR